MIESLTYESFAAHQGEAFAVQLGPDDRLIVQLVEATQTSAPAPTLPLGERFSLIFHGPGSRALAQGTYEFLHPVLGSFPLFIVPIGANADSYQYQAIFNRLKRPEAPTS